MNNNIILIGFSNSGKSTIGKRFAEISGYDFIDEDEFIESTYGKFTKDLRPEIGDEDFRVILEKLLFGVYDRPTVISSGGGTGTLSFDSPEHVCFVYLDSPVEDILQRYENASSDDTACRRRLFDFSQRDAIIDEFHRRAPLYEESSHFSVMSHGKSIDDIAWEIFELSLVF